MPSNVIALNSTGDIAACHDSDQLIRALKLCASDILKNLSRMAAIVRRLDELGVKLEIEHALLPYVRMIANGSLSAECFLACSGDPKLLELATGLSADLQRRVAANEPFKLLEQNGKSRLVGALDMTQQQLKQAFKGGAVRSEEDQRQFVEKQTRAKGAARPRTFDTLVDKAWQLVPYSRRCPKCDANILPGQTCIQCELNGAKRVYKFDDSDDEPKVARAQEPQQARSSDDAPPEPLSGDWLPEVVMDHSLSDLAMDADAAAAIGSRVMLHLYRGSVELAREALEDGWRSHVKNQQPLPVGEDLLDEPLARVLDDVRTLNMLEESDINTIGDLLAMPESELLAIPNLGEMCLAKLKNLSIGLRIRAEAGQEEAVA